MNSSALPTHNHRSLALRAWMASHWVEYVAVPIASAIMETQPIVLGYQFLGPYLFGVDTLLPSSTIVTLLLLAFHWWAQWSNRFLRKRPLGLTVAFAHLLVMLLALGLLILTNSALLAQPVALILLLALVAWAWQRGQIYTHAETEAEPLLLTFKVGLVVLLVVMVFALLELTEQMNTLNAELLSAFPLFFLAGMLSLSFSRLLLLQKDQARNPDNVHQTRSHTWMLVMTVTWLALVALCIALEGLSYQTLQTLLNPLWHLLGLLARLLSAALGWLAGLFPSHAATHVPPSQTGSPSHLSVQPLTPYASTQIIHSQTLIITVVVISMLLLMLFLVLRKRRKVIVSTNQTEIREGLDRSTILKERRAKRKAQQKRFALEPLDPASARAHYREFLLAMAAHGDPLPRQSYETPDEYAQRLLTLLAALPQTADLSAPSARVLLEALTLAYTQERYGTQSLAPERQNALRQGVFALQQCFAHLDKQ